MSTVIKFTSAQQLLLSGLWSLLAAAATASTSAVVQAYTTNGINIPVLINLGLIAFGGTFLKQALDYIPAHAQQMIQAGEDAYQQLSQQHQATLNALNSVTTAVVQNNLSVTSQPQSATPLVVIHSQAAQVVPTAAGPDAFLTAQPAQPTGYMPAVSQSVPQDIAQMNTQVVPAVSALDLMANVPQNIPVMHDPYTASVTGQFRVAGLANLPG